jgi:hypothetical protein
VTVEAIPAVGEAAAAVQMATKAAPSVVPAVGAVMAARAVAAEETEASKATAVAAAADKWRCSAPTIRERRASLLLSAEQQEARV